MARKDLDKKQDNNTFHANRNLHSFYVDDNEEIASEELNNTYQQEQLQDKPDTKEIAKNVEKNIGKAAVGYATGNEQMLASGAGNALNEVKDLSTKEKAEVASNVVKDVKKKAILMHMMPFIILGGALFLIIMVMFAAISEEESERLASGGYYAMRCQEVTVIMTDKSRDYEITGTATYPFEDYIAGVVNAEIGGFYNLEVYKEFAIAARSYFLTHDDDCTIESSDRKQVFRDITGDTSERGNLIHQAVEETAGQVILLDREIMSTEYDAFCSIAVDNNYYTLNQQNQKIPRSWADSQSGIASEWKQGTCAGNHGRGLSQWGSYYLATEQNYTFEDLLKYYLGDEIAISTAGFMTSIPGLVVKDTTDAQELHHSLSSFLPARSSSVDDLNSFVRTSVKNNGAGTRAGVVTAAVSLVNYLYDGYYVRLPYYWGGNYQHIGVNPEFGGMTSAIGDIYGRSFSYSGFDCSGFVSWAIRNGGYNISRHTTATFNSSFSGDSCNINDASCIGQPGDLINSASCHVQMIVAVDEANGIYYVAESTGSLGLITRAWGMHEGNCGGSATKILHMDNYYNNQANVDYNY